MSPRARSQWLLFAFAITPACASGPAATPRGALELVARDAALPRSNDEAEPIAPTVIAVDAATAELVAASLSTSEQVRRIHLANIANVDTPGWKRRVPEFGSRTIRSDDVVLTVCVLLGSKPVCGRGALVATERALDIAIDGDGMFAVVLPDGRIGCTRAGRWQTDTEGFLCSGDGLRLLPEISLPDDALEVVVEADGLLHGRTASGGAATVPFGWLTLQRFAAPEQLQERGANVWIETEASGVPTSGSPGSPGFGTLKQGFLEQSNVDLQRELLALQVVERNRQSVIAVAQQLGFVAR